MSEPAIDKTALISVINHVFLPPKLPQEEDISAEITLLDITTDAFTAFSEAHASNTSTATQNALALLHKLKKIHSAQDGKVSERNLLAELTGLGDGKTLAVDVAAQNAAVLVTRKAHQLVFEQFELSPLNEAVFKAKGRLVRSFPASAIAIDADQSGDFAITIAKTLTTMSSQVVTGMQPQSRKAGYSHDEDRDATNPDIVSGLFFGFLRGIGQAIAPTVITKNTREDVLHKDARRPWRRSPMWLLLRVSLQIIIFRSPDASHELYKNAMLFTLGRILKLTLPLRLSSELYYSMNCKIDQRRLKLVRNQLLQDSIVGTSISDILGDSHKLIDGKWAQIQANDVHTIDLNTLSSLNFNADTFVSLPGLDRHITTIHSRSSSSSAVHFEPLGDLFTNDAHGIPCLPAVTSEMYAAMKLARFEHSEYSKGTHFQPALTSHRFCDRQNY